MTAPPAALEERVIAFVEETDVELPSSLGPETSLLTSGLLDSLALFRLFEWVTEQVGKPIDVLDIDLASEWDTPARIAAFIERQRRA